MKGKRKSCECHRNILLSMQKNPSIHTVKYNYDKIQWHFYILKVSDSLETMSKGFGAGTNERCEIATNHTFPKIAKKRLNGGWIRVREKKGQKTGNRRAFYKPQASEHTSLKMTTKCILYFKKKQTYFFETGWLAAV